MGPVNMDTANKAEKIAAAKKKLKHFQQRGKAKVPEILEQHSSDNDKLSTDNQEFELENHPQETETVSQLNESELVKQIEKLKQENAELLSSYEQSQELNHKLQIDLKDRLSDSEKETRETELEQTISILIEEKNDLIGANQQFKDFVENLKEELKQKEESAAMMKVKLASSEMSTASSTVLKAELSTLANERNTLKQELDTRNRLYDDVCEEHTELKIRFDNQLKISNQRENEVKQLNSELEKLRFHYSQLDQQLKRTVTTVTSLTEEKQNLEHLVLQLQSETETIGEYVSLYQVQRGLLRRRAQQLTSERLALQERTEKLIRLLPQIAPQLEKSPQWSRLVHDGTSSSIGNDEPEETQEGAAAGVVDVLIEICSPSEEVCTNDMHVNGSDALHLDENLRAPHENFHPCQVCSGRLMTV